MNFKLNGKAAEVRDEHPHLLAALREELGVTSPKDGCAPSGQCGCCLVLVDGRAVTSCTQSLASVEGKEIQTLEGLPAEELDRYARAFAAAGALQCGFCTPGIVMRTKALLDAKGDALERDEAARFLGTHLCRCTGYVKILDAIETLAKGEDVAVELPRGLGTSGIKYEGCELAVGRRPFIDDMKVPGMLHGALKLTDHARAEIVSIDAARALEVSGVENVFTAADVPGDLRVGLIHKDWPVFIPIGGITSYLGDVLAIVVAKDRETARRAAELVDVTYRVMRTITDPVAAIDD